MKDLTHNEAISNDYQSRTRKNTLLLFRWTMAWTVTCALMAFGPKFLWDKDLAFTLLSVALNFGVGIGMIVANKKYLRGQDELQRKIMLNAMGITLGIGLIVGIPFSMMGAYHVIPFRADIGYLILLMGLTYLAATIYGQWRYR